MDWKRPLRFWAGFAAMYFTLTAVAVIIQLVLLHGLDWIVCRAFLAGSAAYWAVVLIAARTLSR